VDGLAGRDGCSDALHVKHLAADPVRDFSEGILKAIECVFTFGFDVLFNMSLSESLLLLITIRIVVNGGLLEFGQCVNHLQIVLISILVVLLNLLDSFEVSNHRLLNFSQKVLKCMDLILGLVNILLFDIFIYGMENLPILLKNLQRRLIGQLAQRLRNFSGFIPRENLELKGVDKVIILGDFPDESLKHHPTLLNKLFTFAEEFFLRNARYVTTRPPVYQGFP